jgi:hypothetical protein
MHAKLIRYWPAVAISLIALGASSAAALAAPPNYCDPLAGCKSHTSRLKLSPSTVPAGKATVLHGSVGHGCKTPGQVTIYSRAFKGATSHNFAGVPAVYTRASKKGTFSTTVTIKKSIKSGSYHVGGRCGGGNFGTATLKVT